MTFNKGFLCQECGPVKESKKRSINKVQFDCCKLCNAVVTPWERPQNERAGRCLNCGGGKFRLTLYKGDLLRKCKACDEVFNIDTLEVKRPGKEALKYGRD